MKTAISLLLLTSGLLYYPIYAEEFESPKAFVIIGFAFFAALLVDMRTLITDRVLQVLMLFVASVILSTVFSIEMHMSIFGNPKMNNGLIVWLAYPVLYMAISDHFKKFTEKLFLVRLMIFIALVVSTYAIMQVTGHDFKTWYGAVEEYGYTRPMSSLGQPIFMAAYLSMIAPFSLWRFQRGALFEKIVCALSFALSIAAIFFSASRGMWFACAGALITYAIYKKVRLKSILAVIATISSVITIGAVSIPKYRETLFDRAKNIVNLDKARTEYQIAALRIWKRYPVFGSGTDTYEIAFQHQRTKEYWALQPHGSPHRAHNEYLNVLATQGLVGFACLMALIWAVFKHVKHSKSALLAPSAAAIVAFGIQEISCFHTVSTMTLLLCCLVFLKSETYA